MTFDDYQKESLRLFGADIEALSLPMDSMDKELVSRLLGLSGEAGEVCDKFKKIIRDNGGIVGVDDLADIKNELGDVLWCVSAVAKRLGFGLEEIAKSNLLKGRDRNARGVVGGSGDNR